MRTALIFLLMLTGSVVSAQKQAYLLTGTYTGGKSVGIYVYEFNLDDGSARPVDSVVASNPSYLAVSPDQRFVYAVNEEGNGHGKISAFAFDKKRAN